MAKTVKKMIFYAMYHTSDIERKLEQYAEEGLFLTKIGSTLWTFEKGEPKKTKYTVTYFSEGSMFNPDYTDNQLTYFEYAEQSGWKHVSSFHLMQVFSSQEENPVPFETDEREKLDNIKKCMKKSFIPNMIMLLVIFCLNSAMQFTTMLSSPSSFFSNNLGIAALLSSLTVIFQQIVVLNSYRNWCVKSERSVSQGGKCYDKGGEAIMRFNRWLLLWVLVLVTVIFSDAFFSGNRFVVYVTLPMIPLFFIVYLGSINIMKKFKASAFVNKVVSVSALMLTSVLYTIFIFHIIITQYPNRGLDREHRIGTYTNAAGELREYTIYQDEIPLTIEDLYIGFDTTNYSTEAYIASSFLLTDATYFHNSPPLSTGDTRRLDYSIYETKIGFVYNLVRKEMLTPQSWREQITLIEIDPRPFNAKEAYAYEYTEGGGLNGEYILLYDDKIIDLDLRYPLTPEQSAVVAEIFS